MSQIEFPFNANADMSRSLPERIANYRPRVAARYIPETADRWLLASNLQKSIRRGLADVAEGTAVRLLFVDPPYFWRRLLVIGYEDVGVSNLGLCHDLLKSFRRAALQRDLGPENVAQYFAHELARARKSRSLCDALAALEFSVRRGEYENKYLGMVDEQLLTAICDVGSSFMDRVAALRHVCGYGSFSNGRYQMLAPARPELMREVCRRLELTEMETRLFVSGQSVAESLNIPIPLVVQIARASQQSEQQAEQPFDGKNGILYAAMDRHVRAGKKCFAKFAKEVGPIRAFFDHRKALDPVAVLGAAVFVAEGAALDRWLVLDGTDELRRTFDRSFLEYAGLAIDEHDEFLSLLMANLRHLNRLRASEIG
jgi:hypothetical protein